ncbi:MAG: TetR family transcriptional regulator [Clostridiales bacterium]|nr:TetR family transcriptional regulator [Clostridiales bacterium]
MREEQEKQKEQEETVFAEKEDEICYEYQGYAVYAHFTGRKTLAQCIRELAERSMIE